jgi:hypothetical protein
MLPWNQFLGGSCLFIGCGQARPSIEFFPRVAHVFVQHNLLKRPFLGAIFVIWSESCATFINQVRLCHCCYTTDLLGLDGLVFLKVTIMSTANLLSRKIIISKSLIVVCIFEVAWQTGKLGMFHCITHWDCSNQQGM